MDEDPDAITKDIRHALEAICQKHETDFRADKARAALLR